MYRHIVQTSYTKKCQLVFVYPIFSSLSSVLRGARSNDGDLFARKKPIFLSRVFLVKNATNKFFPRKKLKLTCVTVY